MRKIVGVLAVIWSVLSAAPLASAAAGDAAPVLKAEAPIQVSAAPKRFDLLGMDEGRHRLLAAHAQAGALAVVDTARGQLVSDETLGSHSSAVAVDPDAQLYFVSLEDGVATLDVATLRQTRFTATPGPADAIVYDAGSGKVYAGHDDGTELWVIEAKTGKLTGHIDLPGVPELMDVDAARHRLFLNIKDKDEVAVIDTGTDKIVATWPTPATHSPHGLTLDVHGGRVFVAGQSDKVSVFSLDGKSLGAIDIGPGRVDQIAFDPGDERLYVPSSGRLVVVDVSGPGKVLGSVDIPQGTHSVAVDAVTHLVWIAYADKDHSYVQAFAPHAGSR